MDLIYCSTDGSPRAENNPDSIHSFKAICITHQHYTTSRKQHKKKEKKIEVKTLQQVSKKIPTSWKATLKKKIKAGVYCTDSQSYVS